MTNVLFNRKTCERYCIGCPGLRKEGCDRIARSHLHFSKKYNCSLSTVHACVLELHAPFLFLYLFLFLIQEAVTHLVLPLFLPEDKVEIEKNDTNVSAITK
jgi:hypothetical protein